MLLLYFLAAVPPSSRLSGPAGPLTWTVTPAPDGVRIDGRSPRWQVRHDAGPDLRPRRTEHTGEDGVLVTIDYTATGAVVTRGDERTRLDRAGLWDGDTLDVRLGAEVAAGHDAFAFAAVDPTAAKVYDFDVARVGTGLCGERACTHVRVQLTGVLRYLGPTWHYWYGADGGLLRFEGPAGTFAAGDEP